LFYEGSIIDDNFYYGCCVFLPVELPSPLSSALFLAAKIAFNEESPFLGVRE
jgi:hypothetical protein